MTARAPEDFPYTSAQAFGAALTDRLGGLAGSQGRPSTRYRDLVDLVLVAHSQQVRADELAAAFESERLRRGLPKVDELAVPDEEMWRTGFQTVARDVPSVAEKTLANALPLAKAFVDPVLAGTAGGSAWDPAALVWRRSSRR